jgi:Tfp pilus assembly protein PilF
MLRALLLALAVALALPAGAATKSTDPAARKLIDQARADIDNGQLEPAINNLVEAAKIERNSSEARALLGGVFYELSRIDDSHRVWQMRRKARAFTLDALLIDANDQDAAWAKDALAGIFDQEHPEPEAAMAAMVDQADKLCDTKQWSAAVTMYQRAIAAYPRVPDIHLFLGNCLAGWGELGKAEQAYRKAIQNDRNFEGAWLALHKLLTRQKRDQDADAAAYAIVAALPSTIDGWPAVRTALQRDGGAVRQFDFQPKGSYSIKRNKIVIESGMSLANVAAWTAVANANQAALAASPKKSPFEVQLATWTKALPEIAKTDKMSPVTDPMLRDMLAFHEAGQLKASLFALQYLEAYRADYEAWRKAEPEGLTRFIKTFRVGLW